MFVPLAIYLHNNTQHTIYLFLVLLSTATKEPSRLSRARRYNKTPKNATNSLNPFNLSFPDEIWLFVSLNPLRVL